MISLAPLFVSLKISSISVILTLLLGITLSFFMYQYKGKYKTIIDTIINLPLVLPPIVVGFSVLMLFGGNALGKYVDLIFTWKAGILVSVIVTLPFMYRSINTSLSHIDYTIIEEAYSCGANNREIFFYLILPLIYGGILNGIILAFTRSLGEFGATLLVCGNIPDKTQTISSSIYFHIGAGEYNIAGFWVIVISAISFLFMFLVNRFVKKQEFY
ncbi:MAG: molybdate ABC transporter permease subunit [Lachnospirales bacterium]